MHIPECPHLKPHIARAESCQPPLPNEIFLSIFKKFLKHDAHDWQDVGRWAQVCSSFLAFATAKPQIVRFLKQSFHRSLEISKELALRILQRYAHGADRLKVAFDQGPHFQQAQVHSLATAFSWRKFYLEEQADSLFICNETISTFASSSPHLKTLELSGGSLSDQSLKVLVTRCKGLQHLILGNMRLGAAALTHIGKLKTLRTLKLYGAGNFPLPSLSALKTCTQLATFALMSNFHPTGRCLSELTAAWENLKSLEIYNARLLTAEDVQLFLKTCPKLTSCTLSDFILTAESLEAILQSAPKGLKKLDFGKFSYFKNILPAQIVDAFIRYKDKFSQLRTLEIDRCFDVARQEQLLSSFPKLSFS